MDGEDIILTDGTLLHINMNFYTLYLLTKDNVESMSNRLEKEQAKPLGEQDEEKIMELEIDMLASMIYALLRSNGRAVTREEAMMLVPYDDESITKLMNEFAKAAEKNKKKEATPMPVKQ